MKQTPASLNTTVAAGVLSWLLPGAGHFLLGHKRLAAVFFCAICLPYLAGVAIGGVKTSVNPHLNRWLFMAELGAGGLTTGFYALNNATGDFDARMTADIIRRQGQTSRLSSTEQQRLQASLHPYVSYFPASDVAQIYLAVAGLMNILVILDALTRAQTGGLPVYYHELADTEPRTGGGA